MSRRIFRHPRASRDIVALALYIGDRNPTAARRFLAAVRQAEEMLADLPSLGPARDFGRVKGLHLWHVPGFAKHLIFYRPIADGIEVVRVLHAARDIAGLFDE